MTGLLGEMYGESIVYHPPLCHSEHTEESQCSAFTKNRDASDSISMAGTQGGLSIT